MASKLQYDTEKMRTTAKAYKKYADGMEKTKNDLNDQIRKLIGEHWRSDAGEAFSEMYSADWGKNVDKYVAVLRELAKMLEKAAREYDEVTKLAKQIKI